jgi:hypothetical protein
MHFFISGFKGLVNWPKRFDDFSNVFSGTNNNGKSVGYDWKSFLEHTTNNQWSPRGFWPVQSPMGQLLQLGINLQNGMIKKLQEEKKPNPAEQHYENNEIALYSNAHASVAFSPNPYYGDN